MPTIDQIKQHLEKLRADCTAQAQAEAEEALAEMRKPVPDPGIVEGALLGALLNFGEARGHGNAAHDIENGEVGS